MTASEQPTPSIEPIVTAMKSQDFDEKAMKRIFHGRGHTFDGLDFISVDWYPPVLFVCLFKPVEPDWLEHVTEQLWQYRSCQVQALVVQHRQGANTASQVIKGQLPSPHIVQENSSAVDAIDGVDTLAPLDFYVQLNNAQNVGVFADMINGRAWVQSHSNGKNVLNLFAYTCLFSVAALKGGAAQVVNVDMNKSVMSMGRKNHQLNQLPMEKVKFFSHNIFNSWGKIKRYGQYDLVIIDPPSFQKGSFELTKDYQRLIKRLPDLTCPNGDVILCLNSPQLACQYIIDLVANHCPQMRFVERLANHQNFPEKFPEKSLKVLLFKMDDIKAI